MFAIEENWAAATDERAHRRRDTLFDVLAALTFSDAVHYYKTIF